MEESQESTSSPVRRKFDKKKWRAVKYDNKVKVQKWEEKRGKIFRSKLNRELKRDHLEVPKAPVKNVNKKSSVTPNISFHQKLILKKEERVKRKEELNKIKEEKKKAMEKYKAKKFDVNRKLAKKTKKGQPLMKDRIELLYEKIKENN